MVLRMDEQSAMALVTTGRRVTRRRRFRIAAILCLVALGVAASWLLVFLSADTNLRRAVQEADRLDPGWKIDVVGRGQEREVPKGSKIGAEHNSLARRRDSAID